MGELNKNFGGAGGGSSSSPGKQQPFQTSGTFVVPEGVTQVFVTAVAGGSGGTYGVLEFGSAGGNTTFGGYLRLRGGYNPSGEGGTRATVEISPVNTENYQYPGGRGSGPYATFGEPCADKVGGFGVRSSDGICLGGGGASVLANGGGQGQILAKSSVPNGQASWGAGGYGMSTYIDLIYGGNAGAGVLKMPITVTPGESISVIIGSGGAGGTDGTRKAGIGGDGFLLVEWE